MMNGQAVVQLEVTAEDIRRGRPLIRQSCPIALAAQRQFGTDFASADSHFVQIFTNRKEGVLERWGVYRHNATWWMSLYDRNPDRAVPVTVALYPESAEPVSVPIADFGRVAF